MKLLKYIPVMEPTYYGQETENTRQRSNSNAGGSPDEQNPQFGMQAQLGKMVCFFKINLI